MPPGPLRIAGYVAGGLALGLVLVGWSMGRRIPGTDEAAGAAETGAPRIEGSTPEGEGSAPEGAAAAEAEAEMDGDAGEEAEAPPLAGEPNTERAPEGLVTSTLASGESADGEDEVAIGAAAVPAPGTAAATFERGRVAYLRCGEPETRCGRDRDFEEAAWAAMGALPECAALAGARGTADVRIHRSSDGSKELRFRDWGDSPLDAGRLQRCLQPALRGLAIGVRANPLVVSFRFRLH